MCSDLLCILNSPQTSLTNLTVHTQISVVHCKKTTMRFQLLRRLLHPQPQLISSPSSYVSQQNPSSLTDLSQRQISWPWASWQQWHFKPSNTNPSHCIPTTTTTCNAKHFFFFLARRWRCTLQMSTGFLRSSSQQWSAILQQINLLGFRSKLWYIYTSLFNTLYIIIINFSCFLFNYHRLD